MQKVEGGGEERRLRRKKTQHACVFCQRSHMTCDEERPCQRCIQRRIGHLCHDAPSPSVHAMEEQETTPKARTYSPTQGPYLAYYSAEDLNQAFRIVDDNWEPEMIKPFDCREIDDRVKRYCEENFTLEARKRMTVISAALDQISQSIRSQMTSADVLRSEEFVMQCQQEYEKVIACTTTPFLLVRGGGEILRASQTFADLVRVNKGELEMGGWQVYQLFTEEAFVNFSEKMVAMYFDRRQHSLITNCMLVAGGMPQYLRELHSEHISSGPPTAAEPVRKPMRLIPCGLAATIRRDMYNLPALLALTFVPM